MSSPDRQTPEERRNIWNTALSGLFKGYSERTTFPQLLQEEVELNSGKKMNFLIFGGFGEEDDFYRPEVLVIMSEDTEMRIIAKAKWNEDWPEVEGVNTIGGLVSFTGIVGGVGERSLSVSSSSETQQTGVPRDEIIDVVNKLSLKLRFS